MRPPVTPYGRPKNPGFLRSGNSGSKTLQWNCVWLVQGGVGKSCGVNKCPYVDRPYPGRAQSSSSTWQALIFVLLCNAIGVVLTALLPSLLSGNVLRSTPSSAPLPALRWQATPLSEGEGRDGYRTVGSATGTTESVRQKTVTTLYLFGNRRLLLLAPTVIVTGLSGSFAVAAFHQVSRRIGRNIVRVLISS